MRKYKVLAAVLLVAGFVLLSPAQITWTVEQVTNNTEPDRYAFVATVSSGLMIVYDHYDGDDEVFYADNFIGPWTSSRITDNSRQDIGLDIAARYSEQTAHISILWNDTPDGEISYCVGSPGSWNIERVTDDAEVDTWPSLAIDKTGHIHMTYYKALPGDREIFYANNVTGSWVSEQVTDNATEDSYPWIALDSDDNPNIVFADASNFWFTKKTAGIWTTPELVAAGIGGISYPFLALDADDNCHVAYTKSDGVDPEIYYSNNVTGSWQEAKVTSNDYLDMSPTLVLDPNAKVHIVHMGGEPDAEVYYANNVAGVWTSGRVTDNSVNDYTRLGRFFAVDADRIGHIFFWNNSDGDDEIYHAYSDAPLFAGAEEAPKEISGASITILSPPFSSQSTVSYTVPASGHVSLKVYDASGSLVKSLVHGTKQQGEYTISWNGETDAGIQAAPGVYFYHLTANREKASVKGILK